MNLLPALRVGGRIYPGSTDDTHDTIKEKHNLPDGPDSTHGFVPSNNKKMWLSRRQSVQWLKKFEPGVYKKVINKIPLEGLHAHIYEAAKGIVPQVTQKDKEEGFDPPETVEKERVNLKDKTILIYDRGLYTYMAEFLARYYGRVLYYRHDSEIYPQGAQCQIGKGIPGVEWTDDFWGQVDDADVIFFPYVHDGKTQAYLVKKGYPVCGSGLVEKIEHDKGFLKEKLKEVGMSVAPDHPVTGLDELEKFLEGKTEKYVVKSVEHYRGDWETTTYKNACSFKSYVNNVRQHVGPERAKEMKFIIEDWVESACETGCDGFMLNGDLVPWPTIGFEVKDEGYIARAVEYLPPVLQDGMDKLKPVYQELGWHASPYSNENRITKDGKVLRTDDTWRCGNPPTCVTIEMYGKQYARALYSLAHGEMPEMEKPEFEYGAEIVLQSVWYIKNELHVGCPENFGKYLKLNNMYMRDGERYCDPVLSQDDVSYFGSVVGFGHTLKEATDMALSKLKEVSAMKLTYCENIFDQCDEVLEAGKKWGVEL